MIEPLRGTSYGSISDDKLMKSPQLRKPAHIRRQEIAEALLRLVGEKGATSLTAATLAEEVGVTSGALYRHFTSLDEIFDEATKVAVEMVEATFPSPDLPPIERLRSLAERRMVLFARLPGVAWLLLSDQAYLTVPEPAILRLRQLVIRSREYLLTALQEGIADGSLRSDIRAQELLVIFTGTVHQWVRASSIQARASGSKSRKPERVLDALFTLLSPHALS